MWLEITVKNPVLVAERGTLKELVHEAPDSHRVESPAIAVNIHVLLQIPLAVLKDEDKLGLGVNDIIEADDIDVLKLLHERDLTDSGRRGSFLGIEVNLFQRHNFVCCSRTALRRGDE